MPRDNVTKKDPRKELSPYLNHKFNQENAHKKTSKVSASLSALNNERRRSLLKKLGIIVDVSAVCIIGLGYYISPLANVSSVEVKGADDLPTSKIIKVSDLSPSDKVLDYKFDPKLVADKLSKNFPEVNHVNVSVSHLNGLVLNVSEHETIAYVKEGKKYRKILADGQVGSQRLSWAEIDQDKPLFINYNRKTSFKTDLNLFNELPSEFRNEVKVLSGGNKRSSQIILVMKDGNLVVGNISTLKEKVKYYNEIRAKAGKNSLIDLEVGAYSRPLTANEKKAYGI